MATTIPTLPVYTGKTPVIGQTQPEFNQNRADKLTYDAQLFGEEGSEGALNTTIEAINTASAEIKANSASAEASAASAEQAAAALGYKGEWTPSTVVEIGGIYGYQGSEWRSLTGVSGVAPSAVDEVNWRLLSKDDNVIYFSDLNSATSSDLLYENAFVILEERTIGNGGGSRWKVVPSSSVAVNSYTVVACTTNTDLALKLLVDETTTPKQCGAVENLENDDTGAIQALLNEQKTDELVIGNSVVGALIFPGNSNINIKLNGNIKIADNTNAKNFDLAGVGREKNQVNVNLNGYHIDGNKDNQSGRFEIFNADYVKTFVVFNGKVSNVKKSAFFGELSTYDLHLYSNVEFEEGEPHSGVAGESTRFISQFGGKVTAVLKCKFKQLTEPNLNECRNPSGVFISGSNPEKILIVEDSEFDNLGCNVAGNLESPLDLYSFASRVEYRRNKFTNSRFNPYRATNAEVCIINGNKVIQDVPIINDGGSQYLDAACLTVGIVPRSFSVNDRDNLHYEISNNTHIIDNVNCHGAVASSNSNTNILRRVVFSKNNFKSTGTNTSFGILASGVKDIEVVSPEIKGFNRDIVVQAADSLSTILAGLGETNNCSIKVTGGKLYSDIGLFARTSVSNLTTRLIGVDMTDCGSSCFTVRDSKNLFVTECLMPTIGGNGDTSNNDAFYYWNNIVNFPSDPSGFNTNNYYRLYNNTGRSDLSS